MKKFLLLFVSLVLALGIAEAGVRFFIEPPAEPVALNLVEADMPYAYRLNPEHPEISPQGLRDRAFEIPKAPGTFRVMALGDSVTYGLFVPAERTYPKQLEAILKKERPGLEVVNAGMNGYNTYNELHFFKSIGASFSPDLVLLGFCPNDIADPALHWKDTEGYFENLPPEAFPDPERHRREIAPRVYERSFLRKMLERSALYRFLESRRALYQAGDKRYEPAAGKNWPVYAADEDPDATMLALTDRKSKEWQWLGRTLAALDQAVRERGARLVVLILPLAYQMEEGYPFHPGAAFAEFCRENGITCWDAMPALKSRGGSALYLGSHRYHPRDVWHLSEEGHRVLAEELAGFLKAENLLSAAQGA